MQRTKIQVILFIFTLSAVHKAFKYEELSKIRSSCLAPFSKGEITKNDALGKMKGVVSLIFGSDKVAGIDSEFFLSEFLTAPLQRILDSMKLQNSSSQLEFDEFMTYLDAQKEEIKSGKFDNLKVTFRLFLQRLVVLSLAKEVSQKSTVINISLDLPKIKTIAKKMFDIFKESEQAVDIKKWNELQLILSESISDFHSQVIPAANDYALLLSNAEQYVKYELLNMLLFPEKSTNFQAAFEKFSALFDVYSELISDPKSAETLAIAALKHKYAKFVAPGSDYEGFVINAVRYIFNHLAKNKFAARAFRILRSHLKNEMVPIQDSRLSDLFSWIYKSSKNFASNVDFPAPQKYWALKAWDFVLHIRSDSDFTENDIEFIVEHFDLMLSIQETYRRTYVKYIMLLSDFLMPIWTESDYFKDVWLFGLEYRYNVSKDNSLSLDKFLATAFSKESFRSSFKHIFIMNLSNSLLNFKDNSASIEFPQMSPEIIGEVKELLSLPEMNTFDRILRFLYLADHEKLSNVEIRKKSYVDWISGRKIGSQHFSWLRSSESMFEREHNNCIVKKKLRQHFSNLVAQINEKFVKPSVVTEVSGSLLNDEYNFLTYADKINNTLQAKPQIEFQDNLKTSFTYVQIVMRNSELYKSLSEDR